MISLTSARDFLLEFGIFSFSCQITPAQSGITQYIDTGDHLSIHSFRLQESDHQLHTDSNILHSQINLVAFSPLML